VAALRPGGSGGNGAALMDALDTWLAESVVTLLQAWGSAGRLSIRGGPC
jgi:hypothetical protein